MKNPRIIIFSFLFLIAAFLLLAGRCLYIQLFKGSYYVAAGAKQRYKWIPQKPQRGVILDCRGRVLAASNKSETIFAEPRKIKDPKALSNKLQPILNMGAHEICKLITESKNPGYVKLKKRVGSNEYISALKISRALGVESDWQRHYPAGPLAGHIVGFTSSDNRGLAGVELQFDKELRGRQGENVFFADASRRPIRLKEHISSLSDGVGIILTIDAAIQQFAREELLKQFKSYEAESAVAIVAEPGSGAILAMVSLPDFDPLDAGSAGPAKQRNRAITDQFEPGSLLKPIAAAIAIDAEVIGLDEKIFCEHGSYAGKGFGRIGEYGDHEFGDLAVREILVYSSNIGMAKIGQKLGKDRLYRGLRLFGFGKKTGVDLPGEVQGRLRPVREWTGYSVTRIPFGQEISATAIQMVRAFCVLANGGRPVRPFVVRAMVETDGSIVNLKRPSPGIGFVIKPEIANWIVADALAGVVNEGTGKKARLEKWQVFGKTGTAQLAKSNSRGYSEHDYVASFIAGAPAEDPAVVILVTIRKPNRKLGKGYTGGTVAAPVAAKILEKTLNYLKIPSRKEHLTVAIDTHR